MIIGSCNCPITANCPITCPITTLQINQSKIFICYWPAGRSLQGKTVTEVLKMLPEAAGRGQHFQARGHSFSLYGPTLRRPITFLSFSSCRKLGYKFFTSGFVYATLPFESGLCKVRTGWRRKADGGWRIEKCGWKNADDKMRMKHWQ